MALKTHKITAPSALIACSENPCVTVKSTQSESEPPSVLYSCTKYMTEEPTITQFIAWPVDHANAFDGINDKLHLFLTVRNIKVN